VYVIETESRYTVSPGQSSLQNTISKFNP